jgi:hypothetical protein
MLQQVDRFRPGKIDGGGGGRSYSIVVGSCRSLLLAGTILSAAAGVWATGATADPVPVFEKGLPETVHPTYRERGAPDFKYPTGEQGTGQAGGAGGAGGGGYSGNGGTGSGTMAHGYTQYLGQEVGSGECVALVQATSGVGLTSTWVPGEQVQGATGLAPGTVIATFGDNGTYTNTYGQSHAAIYLGQNDQGIQVMDQYKGQAAYEHTIAWTTNNAYESGSKFYVVSH